jgi:cell division septation protein DedD
MRIGRDHIASTVYTIAFATAGATLSVLLLIAVYDRPLLQVLQTEQFAGEIVRTLVGSIGLVLAVPLTTAIGVAVVRASGRGSHRSRPAGEEPDPPAEEFEDIEPALGEAPRPRADDTNSTGDTGETGGRGGDAKSSQPVAAGRTGTTPTGTTPTGTTPTGTTPASTTPGGATGEQQPSQATGTPAARRRWRRPKEEDDFGFADLRDPDQDGGPRRR